MNHPLPALHSFTSSDQEAHTPTLAEKLDVWQRATRNGLSAQSEGRTKFAIREHHHALRLAETMFEDVHWPERIDDVLAALVLSHHNIVELLQLYGHIDGAVHHLCAPHMHLLLLAAAPGDPFIQAAAWRHMRETRRELLIWRQRYDATPYAGTLDAALAAQPAESLNH